MTSDLEDYISGRVSEVDKEIETCMQEITALLYAVKSCSHETDLDREEHARRLQDFLKYTLSQIDDNEGVERFILPHLEEFRNQNRIQLLSEAPDDSKNEVNGEVINPYEESTLSVWKKFVHCLEAFSLKQLRLNLIKTEPHAIFINTVHIKNYVNFLKAVYEPTFVWQRYQEWRMETLKQFTPFCYQPSCFSCLLKACFYFLCEDQILVHMNDFQPVFITWSHILAIYFKFILDQLKLLVYELENWSESRDIPSSLEYLLKCTKRSKYCSMCCSCTMSLKIRSEAVESLELLANLNKDEMTQPNKHFQCVYSSVILQVIRSLLRFEYQVSALTRGITSVPEHLHFHGFDISIVSQGTKFTLPFESPDTSPVHEQYGKSQDGHFEMFCKKWRVIFENQLLTEMLKTLQRNVEDIMCQHMEKEKSALLDGDIQLLLSDNTCKLLSASIQIRSVLPSVLNTITELERFLPLIYSSDGPFLPVKASFCHVINTYLIDLIKHLTFVSHGPVHHYSIHYLYIAGSTAIFLRDRLNIYDKLVTSGVQTESRHLTGICDKVNDFTDSLEKEMHVQNWKYVSCGILFDACSYDFEDTKLFYEGEHVSYSVQMWNLYMRGFLSDIKFYLPQETAQGLYAKILCDSLVQFCTRYAHISPTEARTPQVKADILTLLLCVSQLIGPACNVSSQFINRDPGVKSDDTIAPLVARIHSICCTLITIVGILTSPISEIYKIFGKKFPTPSLSLWAKYSSFAPWLSWIRPNLYPQLGKEPLMSSVAVWLAVQVCTSWLQPSPIAILKAYTEHHCTLSILFMTQSTEVQNEVFIIEDEAATYKKKLKVKLATSIFQLLSYSKCHIDNISGILLPIIENGKYWEEFDKTSIDKTLSQRPWWYQGFVRTLDPLMKSVICGFLPLLLRCEKKFASILNRDAWIDIKSKLDDFVTCTCDDNFDYSTTDRARSFVGSEEEMNLKKNILISAPPAPVAFACVMDILEGINNNLMMIPNPIRRCLASMDEHFKNYVSDAEPIYMSFSLQVLMSTLITYLRDSDIISAFIGYRLNKEGINLCYTLAQSLKFASLKLVLSRDTTSVQLQKIENIMNHILQHFDVSRYGTNSLLLQKSQKGELEQELNNLAVTELLEQPAGTETILYLQKLLCANEAWIKQSLGIPEILAADPVISSISPTPLNDKNDTNMPGTSTLSGFNSQGITIVQNASKDLRSSKKHESIDSKWAACNTKHTVEMQEIKNSAQHELNLDVEEFSLEYNQNFNPLEHFNQLGESKFNEAAEHMSDFSWEALLSHLPILGLTEMGFCNLFLQRWDVREEGPVPSDHKRMIQELKSKYDMPS